MAKRDLERLIFDLEALVKANLNTKIAAIDAENNAVLAAQDQVTCPLLDTNAFLFQDMTQADAAGFPVFVFFGTESPQTNSVGPGTANICEFFFIVVLQNDGSPRSSYIKLLRYVRALQEIFESNFKKFPDASRLEVSGTDPVTIAPPSGEWSFKGAGVKIRAAFV